MRLNKKYFIILAITATLFYQCKHDPVKPSIDETLSVDSICNSNTVYFQNDILPLIVSSCAKVGCHNATTKAEGIQLTDYLSIMNDGEIEPFDDTEGEIIEVITETRTDKVMPPSPYAPLTAAQIALIKKWIQQGAVNNACASSTICDTVNISFNTLIFPLITNKCTGCHNSNNSASANNVLLTNYSQISGYGLSGLLYGAINHENGYSPMPKYQPKLQSCELVMIKKWIDSGAPNN